MDKNEKKNYVKELNVKKRKKAKNEWLQIRTRSEDTDGKK